MDLFRFQSRSGRESGAAKGGAVEIAGMFHGEATFGEYLNGEYGVAVARGKYGVREPRLRLDATGGSARWAR